MHENSYTLIGHGPAQVIALHGWFGHARGWGPFQQLLDVERFTYAFLDCRGYGGSREMGGEFSIAETAGDALRLANRLNWKRFSVMGHSMGGKAMQAMAIRAPEQVAAMVGITPVPPGPVPFDQATRAYFESAAHDAQARYGIIDNTTGKRHSGTWLQAMVEDSIAHSEQSAFEQYFHAWADTDLSAQVAGNETPTLLVVGEHDPSITPALMENTYGQLYRNVSLEVIGNAGHYPMNETPVNLVSLIERYLQDQR
ncbi:alpha/beta hydrolase fold protein [Cupriavidus basilensis OR16]|uniref:Alpha/beta hydrolase fold protein n=1 Tax=Cupriavidus basilensis OR16 TaxID=1127483 RepID=H1RZG6_9BURK|nr:alpha/beta hydrolase [Cupriavidus basilensis]EHP44308.1 alpha/beta hydrolase fold protein [Cupriavidus basilensis OR16]